MPDRKILEKTYTDISEDYSETISLINAANSWFFLKNMPAKRERVLDLGCGTGDLLSGISGHFRQSYGLEPVSALAELARQKSSGSKISIGFAEELPFAENYFDYVISHLVFQHSYREKAIREAIRVLKPGGRLIVSEPILKPKEWWLNISKEIYRIIWTYPYLITQIGIPKTIKAIKYSNSPDFRKLTNIHQHRRFTLKQFQDFYSQHLPGAKFSYLDLRVECLIWEKK